ncbi:primosomal protein N' [Ehrlichia chaffeensis str. Liberty]|uniref:Replication restart protein PriA n=1 Tax=Ehrlichia chaffeensis (strain ATCC CRL-10679 / Arkansas) TaxID=205920 RepID=Q2GGY4_EHRCR|nr:primosomal protein N' [Ehrlichia chaffeensis]ABD45472.1 primosomal protein N' [Ehrlichia chaffeensis str. Arkansas]AHX05698.1 primosomal protein N' [Ehrlichia chaffeensis str. Jax]AHX06690.1 primosomal protein N' [Ehrlichia chaffeensis str. Liberty]AHX07584.1 primosomal protein N' [Ehrlichia chaffeensis str. Osceola]AHX09393.1 primosomal protein N' [Ehrlichia chaffeensis str. Wakulla]
MIAEILLPVPINKTFYYTIPENDMFCVGEYVLVPFGARTLVGVILKLNDMIPSDCNVEKLQLKVVISKNSLPRVNVALLNFIKWVSDYNIVPAGLVLKMVFSNVVNAKSFSKLKFYAKQNDRCNSVEINLSNEQRIAYNSIVNKISGYSVIVLDGETGSGKTEVYCEVIRELIKRDSTAQALILLPEIVLTLQLIKRIKHYFDSYYPVEWHSNLTLKNRKEYWLSIAYGQSLIVIGARSALFLPYKNLKMIIVDEEHDSSFKQECGVLYNARDMSIVLAKNLDIPIILSSATPSLEAINNVLKSQYYHVKLTQRFGNAKLPSVRIVDLCKSKMVNVWLSNKLYNSILETLQRQDQVMLFLNRRGYAKLRLCKACGFKINCKNCATWLVEHKKKNILLCHYCGYSCPMQDECTNCSDKSSLISYGVGVEKIAEDIVALIPNAKVAIISSDISSKDVSVMIDMIMRNEVNVIIGTQVIAKGHNFPRLTLVGIIDADLSLNNSDLRATERTYQLLHQVSGRSGRFADNGEVILQTYDTNSPLIKSLSSYNRELFYSLELESRLLTKMPPYTRLIGIIISGKDETHVINVSKQIVKSLPHTLTVLGPAPAPISFLNRKYRYRILIKVQHNVIIQKLLAKYKEYYAKANKIRITIDVDPVNFM